MAWSRNLAGSLIVICLLLCRTKGQFQPVDGLHAYYCPEGSCFEADMQDPTIGAGLPKGICRMRTNGMTFTPDLASSSSAEPRRAIMLPPDAPSDPPPFWAMFRAVGPRTGWPLAPCCQDGLQQDCKQGTIEVFESPGSFPRGGRRLANFTSDCVALEWWSSRPSRACGLREEDPDVFDDIDIAPPPSATKQGADEPPDGAEGEAEVGGFPAQRAQFCCIAARQSCQDCVDRCMEDMTLPGCQPNEGNSVDGIPR